MRKLTVSFKSYVCEEAGLLHSLKYLIAAIRAKTPIKEPTMMPITASELSFLGSGVGVGVGVGSGIMLIGSIVGGGVALVANCTE